MLRYAYSLPNGWTDCTEILFWTLIWVAGLVSQAKKSNIFFKFFFPNFLFLILFSSTGNAGPFS